MENVFLILSKGIRYKVEFLFRIIERSVMMTKSVLTTSPQVYFVKEVHGLRLF